MIGGRRSEQTNEDDVYLLKHSPAAVWTNNVVSSGYQGYNKLSIGVYSSP